jgi:IS4 transposase
LTFNILKDELIELRSVGAIEKCPYPLRRIEAYDPETDNVLDFLTTTIATIYKDHWQMEIFFRALKQNLKIKTFVGTSVNAALVALLRMSLFTHRHLWAWLNKPFKLLPLSYEPEQNLT